MLSKIFARWCCSTKFASLTYFWNILWRPAAFVPRKHQLCPQGAHHTLRKADTNDNVTLKSYFAFDLLVFSYDINHCTVERDNGFSYSYHRWSNIKLKINGDLDMLQDAISSSHLSRCNWPDSVKEEKTMVMIHGVGSLEGSKMDNVESLGPVLTREK